MLKLCDGHKIQQSIRAFHSMFQSDMKFSYLPVIPRAMASYPYIAYILPRKSAGTGSGLVTEDTEAP